MCGCAVPRIYIDVCNSYVFSVINVHHDHLKFCVVCINGRRYVCCSECNVVYNVVIINAVILSQSQINTRWLHT